MKLFEKHHRRIGDAYRNLFTDTDGRRKKFSFPSIGRYKHLRESNATVDTQTPTIEQKRGIKSFNSPMSASFRIRNTMNFLNRRLSKKKRSSDSPDTTVSRVMVVAERPRLVKLSDMRTVNKASKRVQPPSPTCVMEQAQLDVSMAGIVGEETKSNNSCEGGNASLSRMDCNPSPEYQCDGGFLDEWVHSPTTERFGELRQMVNTKMEYVHGKIFGNLGESAMTAVEKNRSEMDQIFENIDAQKSMVDPVNFLLDEKKTMDDVYDRPLLTWSDVTKVCQIPMGGPTKKERQQAM